MFKMDKVYLVSPASSLLSNLDPVKVKIFTSPDKAILFYQNKHPTWGLRLNKDKDIIANDKYQPIFYIEEYKVIQ